MFFPLKVTGGDYYVAPAALGSGNGSSPGNAAGLLSLRSYLSSYTVASKGNRLDVWFLPGVYYMPEGTTATAGLSFNTTPNAVNGLTAVFRPYGNGEVMIKGASKGSYKTRFLTLPASTSSSPLTVTLSHLAIVDFSSTDNFDTGYSSLFTVGAYSRLNLVADSIGNISSYRHPLMALYQYSTVKTDSSKICSIQNNGNYGVIETYAVNATVNFTASVLSEWKTTSGIYEYLFYLKNPNASFTLKDCIIENCTTRSGVAGIASVSSFTAINSIFRNNSKSIVDNYGLFSCRTALGSMSFTECRFTENQISGDFVKYLFSFPVGSLSFNRCIIDNNSLKGGNLTSLIEFLGEHFIMTGTTVSDNRLITSHTDKNIVRLGAGNVSSSRIMINNTFSDNSYSASGTVCAINAADYGVIINNTFYRSGGIAYLGLHSVIRNNLLINGAITGSTGAVARNIFNDRFYETDIDAGISLDEPAINYIDTVLSYSPGVHAVLEREDSIPLLGSGGKASATGYGSYLTYDQRGKERPPSISVGSYDRGEHRIEKNKMVIYYDPASGLQPSYSIDMRQYVKYDTPDTVNTWGDFAVRKQPEIGEMSSDSLTSYMFFFHPRTLPGSPTHPDLGTVGFPVEMTYSVKVNGIVKTGILAVIIVNTEMPPSIIDPSMLLCYRGMNTVLFKAEQKYFSRTVNGKRYRYDGFTIPLAGDLDGDGKPEIVTIGIRSMESEENDGGGGGNVARNLWCKATHICILNGQTGEEVVRYKLPMEWDVRDPTHNTPSWMALVDANRNGRAEIIVATGYDYYAGGHMTGDADRKRLISYEVNGNTMLPVSMLAKDSPLRLTRKWTSNARYDDNTDKRFIKAAPLPQVVDIDADGTPEIIVYNKIFNAVDGRLIMELEPLQPHVNYLLDGWNAVNQPITGYRDYAYTGRNRRTTFWDHQDESVGGPGDRNINFAFVYDLDGDGNMEIIAGGKVYYDIDLHSKTFSVKSADHKTAFYEALMIGEGYTGVADINDDGIPEIVVVAFDFQDNPPATFNTAYKGQISIKVWNPGLAEINASGQLVPVSDRQQQPPVLLADVKVPFSFRAREGSLSYVYIGDIDGRMQNGKKFPEISLLGPLFYATSASNTTSVSAVIPMHPNVRGIGIPAGDTYTHNYTSGSTSNAVPDAYKNAAGALMSWTWDEDETDLAKKLKVSFMLEHSDRSLNTGFTLFDFDYDGTQEICYRDETSLRVISASKPVVKITEPVGDVVKFKQPIKSFTGFEYPIVTDIDKDGSADIVLLGTDQDEDARGFICVISHEKNSSKFAPALGVWNQFMYSPLKINEDLTTPRKNLHPLSFAYRLSDSDTMKTKLFNNTITQAVKSADFNGVLKPIVPLPDAVIFNVEVDSFGQQLTFKVKNVGNALLPSKTPITVFRGDTGYVPRGYSGKIYLGIDLAPGETSPLLRYQIDTIPDFMADNYTIRVTDSTFNKTTDLFLLFFEECFPANNIAEIGNYILRDDAYTVVQRQTALLDILGNDRLLSRCRPFHLSSADFTLTTPPGSDWGSVRIDTATNSLVYIAPYNYPLGVVAMEYAVKCHELTRKGKIYIYIVESCCDHFYAEKGMPYQLCLRNNPAGEEVSFNWFRNATDTYPIGSAPYLPYPENNEVFYVEPRISSYNKVDFPRVGITVAVLPEGIMYRIPNEN
ncbi:MAG: hypothetical protein LBS03_04250 [Bacteroidales bacterium]|nr:hypothetical protein [Bacteroidales bacterium]